MSEASAHHWQRPRDFGSVWRIRLRNSAPIGMIDRCKIQEPKFRTVSVTAHTTERAEEQIINDQAEEERRRYNVMRVAQDKASIAAANEKTASRFSLVAPCYQFSQCGLLQFSQCGQFHAAQHGLRCWCRIQLPKATAKARAEAVTDHTSQRWTA